MKQLPLSRGLYTLVDDADYDFLSMWKWSAKQYRNNCYAVRRDKSNKIIKMHRELLSLTNPKIEGDHINGNGLDNQRKNLRTCSHQQNICNQRKSSANSSGYKGVSYRKDIGKWDAYIKVNQKRIWLGCFKIKEDAARAYDDAARIYFGEFARPNLEVI